MPPQPELSVVIPAFNEEQRLAASLEKILAYLTAKGLRHEVLVSDDGSRDGTTAVARDFAARRVRLLTAPENQGKGAALKRGVLASTGRTVLLTDADLSTPIEDLEVLWPHLPVSELVLGSRAVSEARILERQPFYREAMGKTFNRLVQMAGVRGIRDTQCGFKLLDGAAAQHLFGLLVTRGFAYDVELIWLARQAGYRVAEVGVRWANSPDSRVHPLLDPMRMLVEIARFRWHHRGGVAALRGNIRRP